MRDLAPRRARAIASTADLFAYPLVVSYRDMYGQALDPTSPTFSGGFGTWRHVMTDDRRSIAAGSLREPVLRSTIWLDLRAEPWWCDVGEVASDVEFAAEWSDLWGFLLVADRTAAQTVPVRPIASGGGPDAAFVVPRADSGSPCHAR